MAAKIALVTGAGRGIGAATAIALAEAGWDVGVNYAHSQEAAEKVVAKIEGTGRRAIAIQADCAREADVVYMFNELERALGPVDALVNNAGIFGPRGRFDDLAIDDIRQVLDTNVIGAMLCAREAVKRMSTKHGGQGGGIVNISSGSAYIGNPHDGVLYAISKGAMNSMSIGLSQEVAGEGIRVNTVLPGLTVTDMPPAEKMEARARTIPMGRPGQPEEIAAAVVWLLSDAASYTAGAMLRVGGGRP